MELQCQDPKGSCVGFGWVMGYGFNCLFCVLINSRSCNKGTSVTQVIDRSSKQYDIGHNFILRFLTFGYVFLHNILSKLRQT